MSGHTLRQVLSIMVAMGFLFSIGIVGCSPCGLLPIPGAEPEIVFWASEEVVPPGGCAMLHWEVHAAEEYTVFLDGREVGMEGEDEVCLQEPTTFELVVGVPGGPIKETVRIEVEGGVPPEEPPPGEPPPQEPSPEGPPPEGGPDVIVFEVHPDVVPQGGCAMLFWEVHPPGEWRVLLDGQEVLPLGEREECPQTTTTYELLVEAPGGPQERTVTLNIESGPGPEPTPPPPGPTATSPAAPPPPGPTPTSPAAPPPQSGADVWPSDLYPASQPQGVIWVRVVNNGPATLTSKKVSISGSVTRSTKTTPPSATGHNILPQEYTINLAPGQQQNINLGYQIDLNQYNYDFSVTVAAVDFTDPNAGNNTYTESFQAGAPPQTMATLVFENRTTDTVCYVYWRQTGQTSWGNDRLGPSEYVNSAGKRTWQIPAGTYDFRAEDCSKQYLGGATGVVVSGTYNWCIGVC
jgi:hypothetical protein